jgi:hypothetical protein
MSNQYKSKLYKWVFESFGDDFSNSSLNVNNTTSSSNTPYAGMDITGGQKMPVKQDIAGEELQNKYNGISNIKDLKGKADDCLRNIKVAIDDCLSRESTPSSYNKVLSIIQNPETLAVLEHIKQELNVRQQEEGKYN